MATPTPISWFATTDYQVYFNYNNAEGVTFATVNNYGLAPSGMTGASSNTAVVSSVVFDPNWGSCILRTVGPGTANVTITAPDGASLVLACTVSDTTVASITVNASQSGPVAHGATA